MFEEEVILQNETGLHARPASLLVKEASKFKSDIKIIVKEKEYNAKSIMGLLSMGAAKNEKLVIKAEGEDEELAIRKLVALLNNLRE
jgi:phosphocarrier protein